MKKSLAFTLWLTITFCFGITQNNSVDSLWSIWQNKKMHDTVRLNAIKDIIWKNYLFIKPDSAFVLAQNQYDFAIEKGVGKQAVIALNTQGISFAIRGNNPEALAYYEKALAKSIEIKDKTSEASVYGNMGILYRNTGEYEKASDIYEKALAIQLELNDRVQTSKTYNNLGLIYNDRRDLQNAIKYHTQSLRINEELEDKQGVSRSLTNIGLIYKRQNETDRAVECFKKSIEIQKEINDLNGASKALNNLGHMYLAKNQIQDAKEVFSESLKIAEEIGFKMGIAEANNNIGIVYEQMGAPQTAQDYYAKSLMLHREIDNKKGVSSVLNYIGQAYFKQGDFQKSIKYSEESYQLAVQLGLFEETKRAAQSLYEAYKRVNKADKALVMYEKYIQLKDSAVREENQKEIMRQMMQYEYDKKATTDSIQNAKTQEIKDVEIARQEAELRVKKNQQNALFVGFSLVIIFTLFIFNRFKITQKQKQIIESQKFLVEEKNKEITDSINYAKRIQAAILPPPRLVKEYLPQSFILYKPKDIVAGDFYWLETYAPPGVGASVSKGEDIGTPSVKVSVSEGKGDSHGKNPAKTIYFAAADCTGHGVPGAMVSVICVNGLNRSVREHGLTDPGRILDKTREIVIQEFEKSDEEVKDGMDISLVSLAHGTGEESENVQLHWAGANNPLWIIRKNPEGVTELVEVKPNKQPIGKVDDPQPFTTHTIGLQEGDTLYIFTDGYQDQFGGEKGKKFKAAQLKDLLLSIQDKSMDAQKELLDTAFEKWRGNLEQIDDVCIIGVRV